MGKKNAPLFYSMFLLFPWFLQIFVTAGRSRWWCSSTEVLSWKAPETCLMPASSPPTATWSWWPWTTVWACSVSDFQLSAPWNEHTPPSAAVFQPRLTGADWMYGAGFRTLSCRRNDNQRRFFLFFLALPLQDDPSPSSPSTVTR